MKKIIFGFMLLSASALLMPDSAEGGLFHRKSKNTQVTNVSGSEEATQKKSRNPFKRLKQRRAEKKAQKAAAAAAQAESMTGDEEMADDAQMQEEAAPKAKKPRFLSKAWRQQRRDKKDAAALNTPFGKNFGLEKEMAPRLNTLKNLDRSLGTTSKALSTFANSELEKLTFNAKTFAKGNDLWRSILLKSVILEMSEYTRITEMMIANYLEGINTLKTSKQHNDLKMKASIKSFRISSEIVSHESKLRKHIINLLKELNSLDLNNSNDQNGEDMMAQQNDPRSSNNSAAIKNGLDRLINKIQLPEIGDIGELFAVAEDSEQENPNDAAENGRLFAVAEDSEQENPNDAAENGRSSRIAHAHNHINHHIGDAWNFIGKIKEILTGCSGLYSGDLLSLNTTLQEIAPRNSSASHKRSRRNSVSSANLNGYQNNPDQLGNAYPDLDADY